MNRPVTFYFTRLELSIIIAAEILFTVGGAVVGIVLIWIIPDLEVRFRAVLVAVALGLAGAGAHYLRRIYRAAFDERLEIVDVPNFYRERVATKLYLLGRPAISVAMTLAVALGVILTYTSVAPDDADPTDDLVYLMGSVGFVTGFLGGKVIGKLETQGRV